MMCALAHENGLHAAAPLNPASGLRAPGSASNAKAAIRAGGERTHLPLTLSNGDRTLRDRPPHPFPGCFHIFIHRDCKAFQ